MYRQQLKKQKCYSDNENTSSKKCQRQILRIVRKDMFWSSDVPQPAVKVSPLQAGSNAFKLIYVYVNVCVFVCTHTYIYI